MQPGALTHAIMRFERQEAGGEAGTERRQHGRAAQAALATRVRARTARSAPTCCRGRATPRARRAACPFAARARVSTASSTLAPPGWQMSCGATRRAALTKRRAGAAKRCSMKRGSERDSTTPKPTGSTVQPMMSSVLGQVCSTLGADLQGAWLALDAQHAGRGAVAEQRRGNYVGLAAAVATKRKRAGFDRDHQHHLARLGARKPRAERKPGHAAAAAASEHRHAQRARLEPHLGADARFETGRGDAGGRDGDDDVDVARGEPGAIERALRGCDEQRAGAVEISLRALGPAARLDKPFAAAAPNSAARCRH